MSKLDTIRANIEAFRLYAEDRTGRPSKDFSYPPKLIYFYLRMFADAVTYEYIKDNSNSDEDFESVLGCVPLQKVDMVECPCAPVSGCYWLRSVSPLPKMIGGKPTSVSLLKLVGDPDSDIPNNGIFDYVKWERFQDQINSKIEGARTQLYYTLLTTKGTKKQHLYVYCNKHVRKLEAIRVSAIFRDHLEFCEFPQCGEKAGPTCNPLDAEFVINKNIKSQVFERTYLALKKMKSLSSGGDILNNSNDDTEIKAPIT